MYGTIFKYCANRMMKRYLKTQPKEKIFFIVYDFFFGGLIDENNGVAFNADLYFYKNLTNQIFKLFYCFIIFSGT
jgi:hypothetical protein